jgi:hypothetical protein
MRCIDYFNPDMIATGGICLQPKRSCVEAFEAGNGSMEVFFLVCLITTTPETLAQKEFAAKCHQMYTEPVCREYAAKLRLAFDYAENTRNEGIVAGCIRGAIPSNLGKGSQALIW